MIDANNFLLSVSYGYNNVILLKKNLEGKFATSFALSAHACKIPVNYFQTQVRLSQVYCYIKRITNKFLQANISRSGLHSKASIQTQQEALDFLNTGRKD